MAPPIDEQTPEYVAMQQLFQRDINRLYDAADRNARKRGLTKLTDELPWEDKKKAQRSALRILITQLVMPPTLTLIADPTEKVRELALKLLNMCIKELKLKQEIVSSIVSALCARIGGGSALSDQSGGFAEVSEELRLTVVQTLDAVLTKYRGTTAEKQYSLGEPTVVAAAGAMGAVVLPSGMADMLLSTFTRVLQDAFPAIKREGAELLSSLCGAITTFSASDTEQSMIPMASVRLHYKPLLTKALVPNLTHQHNKVRSVTLRAVAQVVSTLATSAADEFETVLADTLGPLLTRSAMNDKNPSVRRELCCFCSTVLSAFYRGNAHAHANLMGLDAGVLQQPQYQHQPQSKVGPNKMLLGTATLVVILLILCGDESTEVEQAAREHLLIVARVWGSTPVPGTGVAGATAGNMDANAVGGTKMVIEGVEEDNAELVCRHTTASAAIATMPTGSTDNMTANVVSVSDELAITNFLCNYRGETATDVSAPWFPRFYRTLMAVVLDGVNGWTMTSRMQYTRGLRHLIMLTVAAPADPAQRCEYQHLSITLFSSVALSTEVQQQASAHYVAEAPNKFATGLLAYDVATTLGVALRSDEPELRAVAQSCGDALGEACGRQHTVEKHCTGASAGTGAATLVAVFAELLIPLIAGAVPGGDTASQRCNAIRTATHLLQGFAVAGADVSAASDAAGLVADVLAPLSGVELYAFKETYVNESVLLLLRMAIARYPAVCTDCIVVKERILLCFVCLLGVHGDGGTVAAAARAAASSAPVDVNRSLGSVNTSSMHYNTTSSGAGVSVVYEASHRDLLSYCRLCSGSSTSTDYTTTTGSGDGGSIAAIETVLSPYYAYCLGCLIEGKHVPELSVASSASRGATPRLLSAEQKLNGLSRVCSPTNRTESGEMAAMEAFMLQPHLKNAFEALVRVAPGLAWSYHNTLVPIMILHTEPPVMPEPMPPIPEGATLEEREALKPKETPEQVMRGYAACRGEDLESEASKRARDEAHLQTRLDLIGLLEDMLRHGALHWECSAHINAAAEEVLTRILLPNLVWKAGRVESATRKLSLAATYALLKAGSVKVELLFKHAGTLTPAIVSHLDDYYDVVPRQISCYCLAIVFERLRGAFSESAISSLYPQLLKRLDDSSDTVRVAIGQALEQFMQAGPRDAYSNTMLGYTLDQLFIHLDDVNPSIQHAMHRVIMQCAELDKALVLRKAIDAQCTHRTPTNCKRIISMCELGYEVL